MTPTTTTVLLMSLVGLTLGGIILSLVQIAAGQPLRLGRATAPGSTIGIGGFAVRMLTAPVIILRGVWQIQTWTATTTISAYMGIVLAGFWSFCIGVLFVSALVYIQQLS